LKCSKSSDVHKRVAKIFIHLPLLTKLDNGMQPLSSIAYFSVALMILATQSLDKKWELEK